MDEPVIKNTKFHSSNNSITSIYLKLKIRIPCLIGAKRPLENAVIFKKNFSARLDSILLFFQILSSRTKNRSIKFVVKMLKVSA